MRFLLIGLDGLRPELVTHDRMPVLTALLERGTVLTRHSAAFPTETYVNLPTLVTGARPSGHGMVANFFLDPRVDARERFEGYDVAKIEKATAAYDGRLFTTPTLGEILAANGRRLKVLSANSAGSVRSSGCSAAGEGGATGGSQRPCSSRCTPRPLSSRSTRARARSAATSSRPSTGVPRRARSTRRSYGRTLRRASSASSSGTASCARRCATRWGRSSTTAGRRRRSAARASSLPKGAVLDAPQLTTLTFWLTT